MLKNNIFVLIALILSIANLSASSGNSEDIAKEFVATSILKDSKVKLQSHIQKTLLKKTVIVRVQTNGFDGPAWQVAVSEKNAPTQLPLAGNLNEYTLALNPFVKEEKIVLAKPSDANTYLKKALNIYGIYQAKIECNPLGSETKYSCEVKDSRPRDFVGKLTLGSDGVFL